MFNTLSLAYDICHGDHGEIVKIVPIEEMVRRHYRWWQADRDNLQYDNEFRRYIQDRIDNLIARRVIA